MAGGIEVPRVVSACRLIMAGAATIFEYIADPSKQPLWDGNDNLVAADRGQRVHSVGAVFEMVLTHGKNSNVRENHVIEFEEGRRIAWLPSEPGRCPPGHVWRWELRPITAGLTRVTHTYDWSALTDESRLRRARTTTTANLQASLDRLAALTQCR